MNILSILASMATLISLDLIWLGVIARDFYRTQLGHLLSGGVDWISAGLFYCMYTCGVYFFVISRSTSTKELVMNAALFGFVAYATYDLTNGATLKNWPYIITFIDIAWGMVITTCVALAGYYVRTLG